MSVAAPGYRSCPNCGAQILQDNSFCGSCGGAMPISEATEDALIGRVIDTRYRVLKQLAAGGMGAVYLAEHVGIGKRVAVKVLRADLRGHPDLVRRFRREAMAVSKLTDAHTISVFDFGVWKGLIYLVMEYLQGADLAAVLGADLRLPVERVIHIAHQICSSLAEAHSLGIIHRDLKPENIFLTKTTSGDEIAKVLDFGLAKMVATNDSNEGNFVTADGALLGTPYFMAPEQIHGEPIDARTDLYAVGGLIFRMVTGRFPYNGRTAMEVLSAHLADPLPYFAEVAPDAVVPPGLEDLVRRLMARDPDDRPKDALVVDDALRDLSTAQRSGPMDAIKSQSPQPIAPAFADTFAAEEGPTELGALFIDRSDSFQPATRGDLETYERRLRRRRTLRWLLVLLIIAGVGGYVGWQVFEGTRPPPAPVVEIEPNDDPAQATPIIEDTPIRGVIGKRRHRTRSDRDIFRVNVPTDRRQMTVTITGVPGMDLVLEVFDDQAQQLAKQNTQPEGVGETLVSPLDISVAYVVVREVWVQGQKPSENSTDAYALTVTFAAIP